jgi:Tol biopolymer transport system component
LESDDGDEAVIYTYELSGANRMQRLASEGHNHSPIWISNSRVAYQSDRGGDLAVWWQPLDGAAERLTTPEPGTTHTPESWFGETLLYTVTRGADVSLWTFSIRTRRSERFGTLQSSAPFGAVFSPDGRWVAYGISDRGKATLYVEPFPSKGVRYPLTAKVTDTPKHPRWSRDGTELFYNPNIATFEVVRITPAPFGFGNAVPVPKRISGGPIGSRTPYDVTADGRLVGIITAGQKEFVRGSDNQIEVILNWFDRLRADVPVR